MSTGGPVSQQGFVRRTPVYCQSNTIDERKPSPSGLVKEGVDFLELTVVGHRTDLSLPLKRKHRVFTVYFSWSTCVTIVRLFVMVAVE